MKLKTIITVEDIKTMVRPVSKHLDEGRIAIYIEEAECLDLKHQIGEELFVDIKESLSGVSVIDRSCKSTESYPDYGILLDGGYFMQKNNRKLISGLRKALAYYTYARMVKNNNSTLTRFGFVEKQDQYSQQTELKERLVAEKDARSTADFYITECVDYLRAHKGQFPFAAEGKQNNKLRISIIGD